MTATTATTIPTISQSGWMTVRHLRALARQPWYVVITLVQPMIWLLLFGELFERVVDIPGFPADNYLEFLTPGVAVMSALFSNGWTGMSIINDLDRGVMDRFLVSPVRRSALMIGPLAQGAVTTTIQTLIIVGVAVLAGARFDGGIAGIAVLAVGAVLLGTAIGSFSNGIALLARREETMIAANQFVVLPATFLSGAVMQLDLAPSWIQSAAACNPANWAVEAAREALGASADWGYVLSHLGLLSAVAVVASGVATRAFRSYQRSI